MIKNNTVVLQLKTTNNLRSGNIAHCMSRESRAILSWIGSNQHFDLDQHKNQHNLNIIEPILEAELDESDIWLSAFANKFAYESIREDSNVSDIPLTNERYYQTPAQ